MLTQLVEQCMNKSYLYFYKSSCILSILALNVASLMQAAPISAFLTAQSSRLNLDHHNYIYSKVIH